MDKNNVWEEIKPIVIPVAITALSALATALIKYAADKAGLESTYCNSMNAPVYHFPKTDDQEQIELKY